MNVYVSGINTPKQTMAHIRLNGKLQIAALSRDIQGIAKLTPEVESADSLRSETRAAIRNHEVAVHPKTNAAEAE